MKSHVCLLKKRPDPSRGGTLRWSLPFDEICYCQGVVAPIIKSQNTCSQEETQDCTDISLCNVWFVDDPTPLTNRTNWNKEALDRLLGRDDFCGESDIKVVFDVAGYCHCADKNCFPTTIISYYTFLYFIQ